MGLRINTNVASLNAQRNLRGTRMSMNKALEKLSSGQRINRAGDDAAGWSGEFSFQSPLHATTSPDDAFSFAVFGDMGIHLGG